MKLTKQNLNYLRKQILPVLLPYGVKRIALFGSVVRGEETLESDLDLLVRFVKPIGLLRWVGLEEELSRRLGKKVDLVSERAISKYIRPYVEKEQIILYERRSGLRSSHSRRRKSNSKVHQEPDL